jgi:hypothetical protein
MINDQGLMIKGLTTSHHDNMDNSQDDLPSKRPCHDTLFSSINSQCDPQLQLDLENTKSKLLFNNIASTSLWKDKIIVANLGMTEFLALKLTSRCWNQHFVLPFRMNPSSLINSIHVMMTRQWINANDKVLLFGGEYWAETSIPPVESFLHWLLPQRIMDMSIMERLPTLPPKDLKHYIFTLMANPGYLQVLNERPFFMNSFLKTLFFCGNEECIDHVIQIYTSSKIQPSFQKWRPSPLTKAMFYGDKEKNTNTYITNKDDDDVSMDKSSIIDEVKVSTSSSSTSTATAMTVTGPKTATATAATATAPDTDTVKKQTTRTWRFLSTSLIRQMRLQENLKDLPRQVTSSFLLWYWAKVQEQKWNLAKSEDKSQAVLVMCILNGTKVGYQLAKDLIPSVIISEYSHETFCNVALFKIHQHQQQQQQQQNRDLSRMKQTISGTYNNVHTNHPGYNPEIGLAIVDLYFPPYHRTCAHAQSFIRDVNSSTAFVVHHQTDKLPAVLCANVQEHLLQLVSEAVKSNNLIFFKEHRDVVLISQKSSQHNIICTWFQDAWKSNHLDMCQEILSRIPTQNSPQGWISVTSLRVNLPVDEPTSTPMTTDRNQTMDRGTQCLVLLHELQMWNYVQPISRNLDISLNVMTHIFPWPMMQAIEFMQRQPLPSGWSLLPDRVRAILRRDAYLHNRLDLLELENAKHHEIMALVDLFNDPHNMNFPGGLFLKLRAYQWLHKCPALLLHISLKTIANCIIRMNDIEGLELLIKQHHNDHPLRLAIAKILHHKHLHRKGRDTVWIKWMRQHNIFTEVRALMVTKKVGQGSKSKSKTKSKTKSKRRKTPIVDD